MKLLANENFPAQSVLYLRQQGWDVAYIRTECPGISDEEVLQKAINEERTILTFDSDYGVLIFKHNQRPPQGIIYFRLERFLPDLPGKILQEMLERTELDPRYALWTVSDSNVRQRRY